MTVKGRFADFGRQRLNLSAEPAVRAHDPGPPASNTKMGKRRDEHLPLGRLLRRRAAHPQVRLQLRHRRAQTATRWTGPRAVCTRAGRQIPLELDATVREIDGDAWRSKPSPHADHRDLGMTWSPLGILRATQQADRPRPPFVPPARERPPKSDPSRSTTPARGATAPSRAVPRRRAWEPRGHAPDPQVPRDSTSTAGAPAVWMRYGPVHVGGRASSSSTRPCPRTQSKAVGACWRRGLRPSSLSA